VFAVAVGHRCLYTVTELRPVIPLQALQNEHYIFDWTLQCIDCCKQLYYFPKYLHL